jgi:hypothetical protein
MFISPVCVFLCGSLIKTMDFVHRLTAINYALLLYIENPSGVFQSCGHQYIIFQFCVLIFLKRGGRSWPSSVSIVTSLWAREPVFDSHHGR